MSTSKGTLCSVTSTPLGPLGRERLILTPCAWSHWPAGERDGFVFTPVSTVVNAFHLRALALIAEQPRWHLDVIAANLGLPLSELHGAKPDRKLDLVLPDLPLNNAYVIPAAAGEPGPGSVPSSV